MGTCRIFALVAAAFVLAGGQTALAQPDPASTEIQTIQSPALHARSAQTKHARQPVARLHAWPSRSPCSLLTCRRLVLLGIAY